MSETTEWEEKAYTHAFDEEMRGLERRKAHDPDLSIEELEHILQALYMSEGNNYAGRGRVADIAISAAIAAYERFISEWRTALKSRTP